MQVKPLLFTVTGLLVLGACDQTISKSAVETTAKNINCQEPEYRQLDFWVGEWDLSWTTQDGKIGTGTNIITKEPFGECVITENFDGSPTITLKGLSVSTYHKPVKQWRQTWVDDTGGYFSLHGGPQEDGTFLLEMDRLNRQGPYRRMIWTNISEKSLDWHWQGKNSPDEN